MATFTFMVAMDDYSRLIFFSVRAFLTYLFFKLQDRLFTDEVAISYLPFSNVTTGLVTGTFQSDQILVQLFAQKGIFQCFWIIFVLVKNPADIICLVIRSRVFYLNIQTVL